MLLERTFQTLQKIGNERLQLPIFYESPISLRFEIGDPDTDIYLQESHLNPNYFRGAAWRLSFLYEKAAPFDTLLWVLYRTAEEETEISDLLDAFCRLTHLPAPAEVYQQEVTTAEEEPMTRVLLFWDMEKTAPKITALLDAILHCDFRGFRELSSAVFFLDTTRHLLFHPYDDRGADAVAAKRETLLPLYTDCQNWLLEYDLERMQQIFSPAVS